MYERPVNNNQNELRIRIINAFEQVRQMPRNFDRINGSVNRRITGCIAANGYHFEQFL